MSTPFYDLASLVVVPSGYKASKVYAQKPLTTDGQLTFSRASTATRVNSAGLIETVSSNVPRLDYQGSTCPKLQLEPQRSNLMLHNSAFDNAFWEKVGGSFTANAVTSPDGTTNADTFTENTSTSTHYFYNATGFSASAAAHTGSIFAKAGTRTRLIMGIYDGTAANYQMVQFDLSAGTIVQQASAGIAKIENYGNGWYRCSVTRTLTASTCYLSFGPHTNANLSDLTVFPSYLGASGTLHFYGAQLEVGSYVTSVIPTTTAAVTRLADTTSLSGLALTNSTFVLNFQIPSYIVELFDFTKTGGGRMFYIAVASSGFVTFNSVSGGSIGGIGTPIAINTSHKIAFTLNASTSNVSVFINGVKIGTYATDLTTFGGFGALQSFGYDVGQKTEQILIFPQVLSDAKCIELTTP